MGNYWFNYGRYKIFYKVVKLMEFMCEVYCFYFNDDYGKLVGEIIFFVINNDQIWVIEYIFVCDDFGYQGIVG